MIKYGWIGLAIFFACNGLANAATFGDFTYMDYSTYVEITEYSGSGGDLIIPDTIAGKPVTKIRSKVFYPCSLINVFIPSSVTYIGTFNFASSPNLTSINVDTNNIAFCSENGVLFDKDKTTLVQFPGGKTGIYNVPAGVTELGYSAFCDASVTGVVLSASVETLARFSFASDKLLSISVDTNSVYYSSDGRVLFNKNGTSLVRYPNGLSGSYEIPSNVTIIEANAFYDSRSLTEVSILGDVTRIETEAFGYCYSLSGISIPASVTHIASDAFINCTNMDAILVDGDNQNYSSDSGILLDKAKTILIRCPAAWAGSYNIPPGVTEIGDSAFFNCSNLMGVTIPSGVTRIGSYAFGTCHKINELVIPDSVTEIGRCAFRYCGLTKIKLPAGITTFPSRMFYGCSDLTAAVIPVNITSIDDYVFQRCTSLSCVVFLGDAPSMGPGVFNDCAPDLTLYCLRESSGFATPTWNGYPCVIAQGSAILPAEIQTETEYETWILNNCVGWNAIDFTDVPTADFETAWLVNTKPVENIGSSTKLQVEAFSIESNQATLTLGLEVNGQPKTGSVNGWLALNGWDSMSTNGGQIIGGQATGHSKLSFNQGQATVAFDCPSGACFFMPLLQKDLPSGSVIIEEQ